MDNKEVVTRLAKPMKKGLLHLIFSRFFVVVLLLLLQVAILLGAFLWLQEYVPWLAIVQGAFTIGMIIYLFNSEMDNSAKLTWMFLISIFPLPGSVFLYFTKMNFGHRASRQRVEELIEQTKTALPQDPAILDRLEAGGSGMDDLRRYLNRSGCFPIYDDTDVTYFPSGEAKFEALLPALRAARESIFLEYFIIEEGFMWGSVLEILMAKAAAGVDVRVMYDGMCEMSQLPGDYAKRLEAHGIRAKAFAPIKPLISSHYNYRDHRKILVIDGETAFTGGVNLADEYINRVERFGHWKDTAVMLRGSAAKSFQLMFLQMWNINEAEPVFDTWLEKPAAPAGTPSGYVMPYGDCPLDGEKVGETVYIDILYRATDYVHIMTPYLILDGEMETALKYAAQRGVDVKLILPGIPDKKTAYALAKTHYRALLESGVQVFEYTPGFVHAKVCVSDEEKAVVGTINLDYRSLYHHFECAAYLYQCACIQNIERDFLDTLAKCRPVTPETIRATSLGYKLAGSLLKFIAPLM